MKLNKIPLLFDMETADPDDFFTLCLLCTHPDIDLKAVTVTPGSDEQIGLVHHVLERTAHTPIPVGSFSPGIEKKCVSGFHQEFLGKFASRTPDARGIAVILDTLLHSPELTILTGAPLRNFRELPEGTRIQRWVAQGGFAGDNVVPEPYRLEKFKGRTFCPTFNFNGDPQTALKLLAMPSIARRYLVSKNVCHGVVYDQAFHAKMRPHKDAQAGLQLIYAGMELYLQKKSQGKKFHDPLAACVAIDPTICTFAEVTLHRRKGEWGAEFSENSNTFISIRVDEEQFFKVLTKN